ncbi:transcription initiation factor TFIID subunit 5 isoform X3 [Phoenix dactylifera]|uniref:Transcription initiation factor TFIID subunit 5 isoform X3 n=1 Tax=Phoenix dactylifera TaxID=42345 RepID=A0A8B9ALM2_PHODC|nr:transcription initiation factor TFIID subunit 5 isoform X3 [Phoenix dactylifera]
MEEEELQKAVYAYLRKKGFRQTELALQEEQNRLSSSAQSDLAVSRLDNDPARYHDAYSKLRSWAYSSLDLYKHELLRVLYPVYIHCFMDLVAEGHMQEARTFFHTFREDHELTHLRDLQKLEGILSPSHLEEMELARSLRQNKVKIKLCEYSYDLLLQYLQKTQSFTMLGIINEHINFEVSAGQPSSISDDADVVALVGSSQDIAKHINQKEVRWGLLEDSVEERLERALSDSEKAEGENKEVDPEDSKQKRSVEGAKQGVSVKKLKKDKLVGATGKNIRSETSTVSMAPRVKPELTLPVMTTEVEQSILEDLRNRVQLSSLALPSISFYTFINTHNSLNCSSISHDGSLVAGGFSDSSLKVWDMAKIGRPTKTCKNYCLHLLLGESESVQNEHLLGPEERKRSYTLFQGHAGPVYSATFSPFGDFLLSSSSDSTIRLWSTKLNSNLVCYKGHNYPVWDVQFSPVGHYFASCSHDRTARIWSMDRIQPLRIMAGHLSDVDCVQWHANCNYIATGSSDKTVRLWDVQSGECVRVFIGHRSMVLSLAMSLDGRYMASGDEDGTIMMWDLSSGRCVSPLMGHSSCIWTLAFSCEGTLLASGSADCTVKLWDVTASMKVPRMEENKASSTNRLRLLKALPTKSTPVYTLRFSRRNLLFAAGALSKQV